MSKNQRALGVDRVEQIMGHDALDLIAELFVGTIHAYAFRFLQHH